MDDPPVITESKTIDNVEHGPVDVSNGDLSPARNEIDEAAALYGNREAAESFGYVHRG